MGPINGVRDASSPLMVKITEADRDAVRCSPTNCVIANALHRRKGVVDQRVGQTTARILLRDGTWVRYAIDKDSVAMIRAYDADGQIMPAGITVCLIPPPQNRALGKRVGTTRGSNKRNGDGKYVTTRKPSLRHIFVDAHAES